MTRRRRAAAHPREREKQKLDLFMSYEDYLISTK